MIGQEYAPRDSLVSLGSQRNSSPDSSDHCSDGVLTHGAQRKEIVSGTKSIAVKAARRRSRVLESDRLNLLQPTKEPSSLSLHSLSGSEGPLCQETPALGLPHAASEDNLSTSTGETASRKNAPRRSPGPWLRASKKGGKKPEKREESLEAKRRKRRSRSFEVTGRRLPCPKNNAGHHHPLESSSEHKIMGTGVAPHPRGIGKAAGQLSRVRLPAAQPPSGPSEVSCLSVTSNQAGNPQKASHPNQRPPRLNYIAVNGSNPHGKEGRSRRC
ncbi:hypothetical protein JRQ81_002014 [Phrynocephalus forsythii]|uniref:Uncharacterized protein n=1 Tax=Phrynocephalus forsythii TaxID=171643 RepID=A0A9Q0XKE1_9SAUR|nr:hypothetical protein JRQ81_002014 [Phrynocephalus forsythii]